MNNCQEHDVSDILQIDTARAKQFDFSCNWKTKIEPHLDDPVVVRALGLGMMELAGQRFEFGDPPWVFGRGPLNGQQAIEGSLSWYQPWGRAHYIAPFAYALGAKLFPKLNWGVLTGEKDAVVLGYAEDWKNPDWVFDILNFAERTAKASIDHAAEGGEFCECLAGYLATFAPHDQRQVAKEMFQEILAQPYPNEGTGAPKPTKRHTAALDAYVHRCHDFYQSLLDMRLRAKSKASHLGHGGHGW